MKLNYDSLKERQRIIRGDLPETVNLRIHRALSWLNAADHVDEEDARFIFLWIAFNAIYGQECGTEGDFSDRVSFRDFLKHLVKEGKLTLDLNDEITKGTLLTQNGEVVHEMVREVLGLPQPAAEAERKAS